MQSKCALVEHYFDVGSCISFFFHLKIIITICQWKLYFVSNLDSTDQDFIVKWRGEIFSWKNLSQLLRQQNLIVPQVLAEVLQQKNSSVQSCQGRCFFDERRFLYNTCFCDKACRTFGDCCLDFHLR